jgi:hypothetical protein
VGDLCATKASDEPNSDVSIDLALSSTIACLRRENRLTDSGRQGLKEFEFGYAAAEEEGAYAPDLLITGYLDPEELIQKAIAGRNFLFLGYKGSGKSAIGQHLKLLSNTRHDLFVTLVTLADFPFTPFKKIIKGEAEPESRYPTAWSWLLLLYLIDSFSKDNGREHMDEQAFQKAFADLQHLGLLPGPDLRRAVLISSKTTFGAELLKVGVKLERATERQDTTDLVFFVDSLKLIANAMRGPSRHLLVIDGLDDILAKRDIRFEAISALVFEANRLNQTFAREGVPAKVIVLCRTDLFERLPGANTNKLRQDAAIALDWYRDSQNPAESDLIRLINHRATLSAGAPIDIFTTFFPQRLERIHRRDGQDLRSFFLDLTRHTPRDMIMLMRKMQSFAGPGIMPREAVLKAATAYSKDYFLPEIKNELSGYVRDEHIQIMIDLLGSMRKREFWVKDVEEQAKRNGVSKDLDIGACLRHMFECSAVGNVETWPSGVTYFTFRYRNRHSAFSVDKKVLLHFGIWKALNLL